MSRPLSREERERLEELFDLAAELPHAERATFAARECGSNDALREELSSLLDGLAGEDRLSQIQPCAPTRAGTSIGPYKLLERIGEGGMGEVYVAQQVTPVLRRVALKIIKPGMDSAQVVARFEAERQALARMTHPNIAQIYDGGTTGDGRPYFVMEYVAGEPVTEYCDRRKLATRERLELFLGICDGVEHAHHKGVIHRDLKPSNLLVATTNGAAVPKIIDFGVARATSGSLTERTLHTMLGQIIGTLDYMSPEQANPTAADIDTRSDVYTLGVVLYQLVSGLLPFEHRSAVDLPFFEIQRTIREKDPPTPSTRLRRERGTATVLAPLHGTNERTLIRELAGDLDWICMKALEKDPARRYSSASEFADDVRRHLAHEPVLASRAGALYRARKFVRRNRVGVTAAGLVAAGLAVGGGGLVSGRLEALASEQRALAREPHVDSFAVQRLLAEADELWPTAVEQLPRMVRWIEEARELTKKLPRYSRELEEMRSRALPWNVEEQDRDHKTATAFEDLEYEVAELAHKQRRLEVELPDASRTRLERRVGELESSIPALRANVAARRTWSFESDVDRSTHKVLADVVDGLARLSDAATGLLAENGISPEHGWSMPKRRVLAQALRESFAEGGEYAEIWRDSLPAIREAYPGLELEQQVGLVPLGPDPFSRLWEFAHLPSGAPAVRGADGKLVLVPETGIVLVLIPGASFVMGSQNKDSALPNYYDGEIAPRAARETNASGDPILVSNQSAFFLSKYETTQGQWKRGTGANPSNAEEDFGVEPAPMNPVNFVTWTDCDRTVRWLGLRLPSEEEWEYAARAGTDTPWWTGRDEVSLEGAENVFDRSSFERFAVGAGPAAKQPAAWDDGEPGVGSVGIRRANGWGLHDVCGNVAEWCSNPPYLYGTAPGAAPGTRELRSARGGSARLPPADCRTAARLNAQKGFADPSLGLRTARSIHR